MNKKEKLELKLKLTKLLLSSDDPATLSKELNKLYPEILDETIIKMRNNNDNDSSDIIKESKGIK